MVGIYFSGTGNTRFCVEQFLKQYDSKAESYSIEDGQALEQIKRNQEILFAYPIQYSNLPKIVHDFLVKNESVWRNKRIFILATMGLFSGDGAGLSARYLKRYGATILGGLHLQMPDCIGDTKALKRPMEKNQRMVHDAIKKAKDSANRLKNSCPTMEGLGALSHMAGLFGQRLYFHSKTKDYTDELKINAALCTGCGLCAAHCPMNNISIQDKKAVAHGKCTMCYRCVNGCPKQAITLLGKEVYEQCRIEKYLSQGD